MHSSWFVNWFESPNFLARAGMKVTWPQDPLACWDMARSYMEDGYDRFGTSQIKTYVCTNFDLDERLVVLTRLYKLARIMDLFGLMDAAFTVLIEMENFITPVHVLTLARYIFGGERYCEPITLLRKWCLKWIAKHYDWLNDSQQWEEVIENAVPELEEQWSRIKAASKIIAQEELKRSIQQNVSDANAIIKALTAVDTDSEESTQRKSSRNGRSHGRPLAPKAESISTKLAHRVTGSPTKRMTRIKQNSGLHRTRDTGLVIHENRSPPESPVSYLQQTSETEEGDTVDVDDTLMSERHLSVAEAGSLKKSPGPNLGPRTLIGDTERHKENVKFATITTTVNGALPYSVSERLLTSHRNGHTYENGRRSTTYKQEASSGLFSSDGANGHTHNDLHQSLRPSTQRGVILTSEALRLLDGWPLSDIPLRDPLLPVPVVHRSPSLDHLGESDQQNEATLHQARAVTVFGLHRPGMGGSVIDPTSQPLTRSESRAGIANEAKARELLGMNEATGIRSRSSMDIEPRKLKKRGLWAG